MRKLLSHALLIAILIGGLALTGTVNFPVALASTDVKGIISSDTTWTKSGSPYFITGKVLVDKGVTLTIEPGVTVNFTDSDIYMQVDGTLVARGSNADNIHVQGISFNWIKFTEESSGWNEQTGTGSIIENVILNRVSVSMIGSQKVNNNTFLRCKISSSGNASITNNYVKGTVSGSGDSLVITNNTILGDYRTDSAGLIIYSDYGLKAGNGYFADNFIAGRFSVAAVKITGNQIVERNFISNYDEYHGDSPYPNAAIELSRYSTALIQDNTITKSAIGIRCDSSVATIINNNIKGNSHYNVYLDSGYSNRVNVAHNWWGTTNTTLISELIYDFEEDFDLNKVTFTPFLTEINQEAPRIPTQLDIGVKTTSTVIGSFTVRGMLTHLTSYVGPNRIIHVSYSVTGDSWIPIGSGATGGAQYSVPWNITDSGTFMLKAEWPGDDEYAGTSATIWINYLKGTNSIEVIETTAIPEFPSWIVLQLFLGASLVVILYRKKMNR